MPFDMPPSPATLQERAAGNDLFTKLAERTRAVPEGEWRGHMKGQTGSARSADIHLRCRIGFTGAAINGRGEAIDFPRGASDAERAFEFAGPRNGAQVSFVIAFNTDHFRDKPFTFNGMLSQDEREITGGWVYRCGDCHCGGSTGTFRLWRTDGA